MAFDMIDETDPLVMRASYLEQYPLCQYALVVGRWVNLPTSGRKCVDHIWNRKGPASEHTSNYATASPAFHHWKHAHSVEARIAITAFKYQLAQLTGDWDHFDQDALRRAAGFNVLGWISVKLQTASLPPWCVSMGTRLLHSACREGAA